MFYVCLNHFIIPLDPGLFMFKFCYYPDNIIILKQQQILYSLEIPDDANRHQICTCGRKEQNFSEISFWFMLEKSLATLTNLSYWYIYRLKYLLFRRKKILKQYFFFNWEPILIMSYSGVRKYRSNIYQIQKQYLSCVIPE